MFTGIIQSVGEVVFRQPIADGMKIGIAPGVKADGFQPGRVSPGDSIAVNGACLTLTGFEQTVMCFDVSGETLSKCLMQHWQVATEVNLETALTLQTPIGGHLVCGHVDGIASLIECQAGAEFATLAFATDHAIGRYIAAKGSLAIDGVSLTSNRVADEPDQTVFDVMLVPHTLQNTTLGKLDEGVSVHIEVDQVARYIERMYQFERSTDTG